MNRWIKIAGNVLTVLAVGFVIWKLASQHIDYSALLSRQAIVPLLVIVVAQTLIVIANGLPWTLLVSAITDTKISFRQTCPVYLKSNLMKYIPGNIFQYVGRNEFAARYDVSHIKIASATIVDVALNVLSGFIISLLFFRSYIFDVVAHNRFVAIGAVICAAGLLALLVVIYAKRQWVKGVASRYSYLLSGRSIVTILECLAYYLCVLFAGGVLFALVVYWLLGEPFQLSSSLILVSAYTLAWLVGFITPGAPAGIGIKEAVMIGAVSATVASPAAITLAMVVTRIIMTIADVLAFLAIPLITRAGKQPVSSDSHQAESTDAQ
ncbi:lysylphosphatidylglycerol synthase domain-containing protein [Bifidobacterium tibiigranuli]|jgi:uncharacterized membrane protein YbhN (UPF0104 family)|uniref:Uncharacterized protein n=1 Tax=Bifidobacterium tibiigranuli TaxID=2172043 RepID=A0A5N6S708_9BIFI|nr:lysylphosphatidylglycerol synthase domain-containing protein [Bifidobacterium tibiigranuli]MCI1242231.1 flippase-like domain-containing protein [Bifidobacterium subtile]KAE8126925.1 hypothetical protein DDE84_09690 [Bifidobacterium tibiigranuli]KAE8129857.1 hypothetical protein DDF78_01935 [Bifidobacterium tibiigranuli]MCI1649343.1 flippase-like domain-containing protein [Bifidobacterium tibiigranuli]MCI1674344.1 flippase-like domain-containing protein [Bifidobacterium tibiigranuli]